MSLKLVALIMGIIALIIPAIPTWVGQMRVQAFGNRIRATCVRKLEAVEKALPEVAGMLIVFALVFLFGGGGFPDFSAVEGHHSFWHETEKAFLDGLFVPAVLVSLALAVGVVLGIVCILIPIVARIPTGPRMFVTAGVLFGVTSLVTAYATT
jgi:hypothetical protein